MNVTSPSAEADIRYAVLLRRGNQDDWEVGSVSDTPRIA